MWTSEFALVHELRQRPKGPFTPIKSERESKKFLWCLKFFLWSLPIIIWSFSLSRSLSLGVNRPQEWMYSALKPEEDKWRPLVVVVTQHLFLVMTFYHFADERERQDVHWADGHRNQPSNNVQRNQTTNIMATRDDVMCSFCACVFAQQDVMIWCNRGGRGISTAVRMWTDKRLACRHISGADPGFPIGGGANHPGGGANLWFCQYFPKHYMKLRKLWAVGGRGRRGRPI